MNYLQQTPESAAFGMPLLIQCARQAALEMSTQVCHCVSKDPLLDWVREWRSFIISNGSRKLPDEQYMSYYQHGRKTLAIWRNCREEPVEKWQEKYAQQ